MANTNPWTFAVLAPFVPGFQVALVAGASGSEHTATCCHSGEPRLLELEH